MYGYCELIYGSMYCGKTEELLRRLRRVELANMKYVLFKPYIDNRYGSNIVATHDSNKTSNEIENILNNHVVEFTKTQIMKDISEKLEGSMKAIIIKDVKEILSYIENNNVDVIGIDELQFFDADIIDIIEYLIKNGKRVICAGLDMYANGKPFGKVIPYIACISKNVHKLHAVCNLCGENSVYSHKISDNESNKVGKIDIGSNGKYIAVCEKCKSKLIESI